MSDHADLVFTAVNSADAHSTVIASWRRCIVKLGLHPDRTTKPEPDLEALREAQERNALLIAVATPCLDEFSTTLVGIDAVVMLADQTGLVLVQRNGRADDFRLRAPPANVGIRYAEQDVGTGPIGTVLAEERALRFEPGQCFSQQVKALSSMGAPIFGPLGQLVGVVACGFTAPPEERHPSFSKLLFITLSQLARRIGTELFARTFPQARLLHIPQTGGWSDAMVAVGPHDAIIGATRSARRLLGLNDERLGASPRLGDLFGAPVVSRLAAAEAQLITQTMMRYANNRSAVAKALGISRSTLYRKLDEFRIRRDEAPPEAEAEPQP